MPYTIASPEDLDSYNLEDLESFLKADAVNARSGRDLIVNPALELELVYSPVGYVCNGA